MKVKVSFTVKVDPAKFRAEFDETRDSMPNSLIREMIRGDAEDASNAWLERIGVKPDSGSLSCDGCGLSVDIDSGLLIRDSGFYHEGCADDR